jgi:hypothetical protein
MILESQSATTMNADVKRVYRELRSSLIVDCDSDVFKILRHFHDTNCTYSMYSR